MTVFLTVREAAMTSGKSMSSIRRIIYPIIRDEKHPDRLHIQPGVEEAKSLRAKGDNFPWRLSDEFLRRVVPVETPVQKGTVSSAARANTEGEPRLIAMLQQELTIKNQQISQQGSLIEKQIELIAGLSQRLGEGNVLIASLQKQLALTDGRGITQSKRIETRSVTSAAAKKGSTMARKSAKPKRGFFSRFFRRS